MTPTRLLQRLSAAALLALAPLSITPASAQEKAPAVPAIADDDVVAQLDRAELVEWKRAMGVRASAMRDLEKAKSMAQAPRVEFKGFQSETPEMRKAKADKVAQDANAKLAESDKSLNALRVKAAERLKGSSVTAACALAPLPDAIRATPAPLLAAAAAAGYDRLALAGVFLPARATLAADPGLSLALREAFETAEGKLPVEGAPSFAGKTLRLGSAKCGVVVGEVHPMPAQGGALWAARLIDGKSFRVVASTLTFIANDKAAPAYGAKAPARYEVTLQDKRNFFGRLGATEAWSFGVSGTNAGAAMMRSVLLARGTPEVNDYAFLAATLRGDAADPVSKALWVVEPAAGGNGFAVTSRPAGRATGGVEVGELLLAPAVEPPAAH